MSRVTGLVVISSLSDETPNRLPEEGPSPWVQIDEWLQARGYGKLGPDLAEKGGGRKYPPFVIACAGLNYFEVDQDEFIAFFLGLDWRYPEDVILVLQPEESDSVVIRPRNVP